MKNDDIPEWSTASDGTILHRTTILCRIKDLKWKRSKAMAEPVRPINNVEEEAISVRARRDLFTPGKVQFLMRTFGTTYEDATEYLGTNDPGEPSPAP